MAPSRKAFSVAAALVALLGLIAGRPDAATSAQRSSATPQPKELLAAAVEADDHVSYTGTLTTVLYGRDRADSTVVRVDHKAPQSWRIWYVAPADAYGRMIISNESLTYQYEAQTAKVFRNQWVQSAPAIIESVNVAQVDKNYSFRLGALTMVAGRPARVLELVSKHTGALAERMWTDEKTKLPLRRENYHADGTIASKTGFDNIKIVTNLPKELFDLAVPSGMTLVPGAAYGRSTSDVNTLISSAKFKFANPTYLPYGFTLQKGSVDTHEGVETVQLVYSDGIQSFSLFENPTGQLPSFDQSAPKQIKIGDKDGESAYVGGDALISWNANGLNLTMVGDLTPKELATIGASIAP
ncbi:MAG: hypothetical protein GIW99_06195 [Candidatus Eremiobacteraeota bacterium]|nr:hypothetical protein [Candidatus Eremiobacteraeota bacterium]MBC5827258.1 hypothetical protein [Candidatus Eremiobacteraeota bacterium]